MKCNRTVCNNPGTCRHSQNGHLYCLRCARKINEYNPGLVEVPNKELLWELRQLTRTNILRTDEEAAKDRERVKEICRTFEEEFPDDVFERFGHWLT